MSDSFATRDHLSVNGKTYAFYSLAKLGQRFDLKRLPYSMKILLENLLRCEDGGMTVGKEHIEAVATWDAKKEPDTEIAFMPARVVLQDFTGVPCVVDLAAMRDAVVKLGGKGLAVAGEGIEKIATIASPKNSLGLVARLSLGPSNQLSWSSTVRSRVSRWLVSSSTRSPSWAGRRAVTSPHTSAPGPRISSLRLHAT